MLSDKKANDYRWLDETEDLTESPFLWSAMLQCSISLQTDVKTKILIWNRIKKDKERKKKKYNYDDRKKKEKKGKTESFLKRTRISGIWTWLITLHDITSLDRR